MVNQSDQMGLTVRWASGDVLGSFVAKPRSIVFDLKRQIVEFCVSEKGQGAHAALFQNLFLPTSDPIRPVLLEDGVTLKEAGVHSGDELVLVNLPLCKESAGCPTLPSRHERQQCVPWISMYRSSVVGARARLPDLTQRLVDSGIYGEYVAWRDEYCNWRKGRARGAPGELSINGFESTTDLGEAERRAWRDSYRKWRLGHASGAHGEPVDGAPKPLASIASMGVMSENSTSEGEGPSDGLARNTVFDQTSVLRNLPAVVYDVVAGENAGRPALVPVDGPETPPVPVENFPGDALVTIRVFRFFEDRSDNDQVWEQELQNVNSGSLLWLAWHLSPGMHSKGGAKYGSWFTVHYVQVYAKHFNSAYHMANEGSAYPAKTFGSAHTSRTVSGKTLPDGYFWYVSPTTDGNGSLEKEGWQHLCRAGPFDGRTFLNCWNHCKSPLEVRALQRVLNHVSEQ